jgi:Domain of unknown function (DUF222)
MFERVECGGGCAGVDVVACMPETSLDGLLGGGVAGLPDHELVEAMTAARALASRAQAIELAAVAELARRRLAEDDVSAVEVISPRDYLTDEVAQALTLTPASADGLLRFATELVGRLPGTFAALASGDIDYCKARTLWRCTDQVNDEVAAEIEMKVLPKAPRQTTGEIRAKARRLVKRLDPEALRHRREAAQRRREVTLVETDDGTAHLAGADLPADAAGAAYRRISAIAAGLKRDGDSRGIDQLRADVFVALLRGTLTTTEPPADTTAFPAEPVGRREPVDGRDAGWSGVDDAVADVIAAAVRAEFTALASDLPDRHRGLGLLIAQAGARVTESLAALRARWCLSDHDGSRHGGSSRDVAGPDAARHGLPGPGVPGRAGSQCTGRGYRVPVAMRRLIEYRDRRCCFPGCRRPVRHCDADHSTPFYRGGPTCPCNLALLCRRHHRLKQTKGWRVEHLWPGVILWIGPTGDWRITAPADRE